MEGLGIVTSGTMPAGTQSTCGGSFKDYEAPGALGGLHKKSICCKHGDLDPQKTGLGKLYPNKNGHNLES